MNKISIVIRSRNDAPFIGRVLDAISAQKYTDYEIINFDNASTDGTREILSNYQQVRSFSVPEGKYIPGKILNAAVRECKGEIIVFNNSDAIPQNNEWLENLINPILLKKAAATYARQVARPNAYPWVRFDYKRAFGEKPLSDRFFSLVSSAASKDILQRIPFDEKIKYSEDVLWAKTVREQGNGICYASNAIVEHSHNYSSAEVRKRFYGEGYADGEIEGKKQSSSQFLKGLMGGIARDIFWLWKSRDLKNLIRCIQYRFLQKKSYRKGLLDYIHEHR